MLLYESWEMLKYLTVSLAMLAVVSGCQITSPSPPSGRATPLVASVTPTPAAMASASPQVDKEFLIVPRERFGPITSEASEESLKQQFGPENIQRARMYVGDGMEMDGIVVFPNQPEKAVQVFWFEEDPKRVKMIQILGAKSEWKTAQGITLGTTLRELESLNGVPFDLLGLGWLGGSVSDWKSGALEGLTLRCDDTSVELTEEEAASIMGDQVVQSYAPAMRKANPKVSSIAIRFTGPETAAPSKTPTP